MIIKNDGQTYRQRLNKLQFLIRFRLLFIHKHLDIWGKVSRMSTYIEDKSRGAII